MSHTNPNLPQLNGKVFLTDGGLETCLVFHEGFDLPYFSAFDLLKNDSGVDAIKRYFTKHMDVARRHGVGFVLESPTWRASSGWGQQMGYTEAEVAEANKKAIVLLDTLRREFDDSSMDIVISGCVGPRGDGYVVSDAMTAAEAEAYHAPQIAALKDGGADLISALTMNYTDEALGIVRASEAAGIPVSISFTVETDGRLPDGSTLKAAIERVDRETGNAPAYYMINCAHPTHFSHVLESGGEWLNRIRGIRANASALSHAELDEAEELDDGDPQDLGSLYKRLKEMMPHLTVLGGCCGTDHRHIDAIAHSCLAA